MADIFEQALGRLSGGRVLDLATGEGSFVELLAQNLKDYTHIVGADVDGPAVEAAAARYGQDRVSFVQSDGGRASFAAACFDTVAISASLHHLVDIPTVLAEAGRLLKPGGYFVLAEMHCDAQTEAQYTVIALHHWIADVASALGMVHNRTLSRQELVDHARGLGLAGVACYDSPPPQEDPMEESFIRELDGAIDRTLQQAADAPDSEPLLRRGQVLRARLHQAGAQWEPVVIVVGRKG
jgi:2-polyprenyl-3-methyl-5-hydroxy-6-metoxy-1,4-benzoquinol methylase